MCDADDRNKQALYVLENEWGCGRIDLGALRSLLRGDGLGGCSHQHEEEAA
jgi:hypothetical protein